MPRIRHRLEQSLILLDDYLHPLFGANRISKSAFIDLKQKLGEFPDGYDSNGRSYIAQRLRTLYQRDPSEIETYDDNIRRHIDAINARRPQDEQIVLKYFQHLSLLYTEHLLHRVFTDIDGFVQELNGLVAKRNQNERSDQFDVFTPADLTKLAYWMATGSGKTLLMHLNYHQIRHYMTLAKQQPYENILLITPNAGLSQQHLTEFTLSDIPAQLFRQGSRSLLEGTVQIIEITKFTTNSSGPQTVNVGHFEGHNLIFVDEGHRGASGDVWLGYRDKLAADGFTFEYSATFGEAFNSGNKAIDIQTRHTYGKSIAFDYSYRYFYRDGYGKDYSVLNLPNSYHENQRDTLLLASLLTFFEQSWVYQERNEELKQYSIERPLLLFVGHTVQAGKTQYDLTGADEATISDVLDIVRFLHRVAKDPVWSIGAIQKIIDGKSGLTDDGGIDIFRNHFRVIKGSFTAATAYLTLLDTIFHTSASGPVHLSNLSSAAGEISLRVGTTDTPFGVINIGDDQNFLSATEKTNFGLVVDPADAFRGSLFETINHTSSNINILVGAKKFTEGWNSWRVSGMGLLNVGRSEGSEVIQMFGRGVRLRGHQRSLKRSTVLPGNHPLHLPLLETLNIFSVKGNYLSQFKEAMDREGIVDGYEEIYLPVKFEAFEQGHPQLYVLRPRGDVEFVDQPSFSLEAVDKPAIKPTIDLNPRVQSATSLEQEVQLRAERTAISILPEYLNLLDWEAIYREILAWRRNRNFQNMTINREVLQKIVESRKGQAQYYVLYAPEHLVAPSRFSDLYHLQMMVLDILKQYAERFYNHRRQQWESDTLEYRPLDKNDPNLNPTVLPLDPPRPGYVIKINRNKPELVEALETLLDKGDQLYQQDQAEFPNIVFDRHLYTPLITRGYYNENGTFTIEEDIKSVPVGLNKGETRFVWNLRKYLSVQGNKVLGDSKLYLLRNLSRGKGIGFFEASNFYPDFILWLVAGEKQVVTFIDPKGLAMLRPNDFSHPKIQLFSTLQEKIAPRLNNPKVILDSYVISETDYEKTKGYFGSTNNKVEEFRGNHVLFPGTAASDLLERAVEQL